MSSTTSGTADQDVRVGLKGATIGALAGTFAGVGISAVANAATGVPVVLATAVANPFTALLVVLGVSLGYLEAVA